jgi:hypothetical protein
MAAITKTAAAIGAAPLTNSWINIEPPARLPNHVYPTLGNEGAKLWHRGRSQKRCWARVIMGRARALSRKRAHQRSDQPSQANLKGLLHSSPEADQGAARLSDWLDGLRQESERCTAFAQKAKSPPLLTEGTCPPRLLVKPPMGPWPVTAYFSGRWLQLTMAILAT